MSCWTPSEGRELCRFNSAVFERGNGFPIDAPIVDIAPGAASSSPDQITLAGQYVYFTADDGLHGREVFAVALRDTIDRVFHDPFE